MSELAQKERTAVFTVPVNQKNTPLRNLNNLNIIVMFITYSHKCQKVSFCNVSIYFTENKMWLSCRTSPLMAA